MKIDKIAAGYTRKFNLGDYNSIELECTCWADVEDGDDPQACIAAVQNLCRDQVKEAFQELKKQLKGKSHTRIVASAAPAPPGNTPPQP